MCFHDLPVKHGDSPVRYVKKKTEGNSFENPTSRRRILGVVTANLSDGDLEYLGELPWMNQY